MSFGGGESDDDPVLVAMVEATRLAGLEIKKVMNSTDRGTIEFKSNSADFVTETDKKCQTLIMNYLNANLLQEPHVFLGEESEEHLNLGNENTFICDPIDGTSNFFKQIPLSCVLLAQAKNKVILNAVCLDPNRNELYVASKGKGAFLYSLDVATLKINSKPVRLHKNNYVNIAKSLKECTVFTDVGYKRDKGGVDRFANQVNVLLSRGNIRTLRVIGSCGLGCVFVARGLADVYLEYDGPFLWDFAASSLICTEAGMVVCDPKTGLDLDFATSRSILCACSEEIKNAVLLLMQTNKNNNGGGYL